MVSESSAGSCPPTLLSATCWILDKMTIFIIYTADMKRLAGFLLFLVTTLLSFGQPIVTTPPDKIYGKLFVDVQMNRVFADGKTFVDCVPKRKPAEILADYETQKETAGF